MSRVPIHVLKGNKKALAGLQAVLYFHRDDLVGNYPVLFDAGVACFGGVKPTINSDTVIYGVAVSGEPYLLFDTDKNRLEQRAKAGGYGAIGTVGIVRHAVNGPELAALHAEAHPADDTDDIKKIRKVLHEIKSAAIGDDAVQQLLDDKATYSPKMIAFLNSEKSKHTREALGLPPYKADGSANVSGDHAPNAVCDAARNIINNVHHVATARETYVAFNADHQLRDKPVKIAYVDGFMPRLGNGGDGCDIRKYFREAKVTQVGKNWENRTWKTADGKQNLQADFKTSLIKQMKAAAAIGRAGLVINPPSAFLNGLSPKNREEALVLWMNAADEAAKELTPIKLVVNTHNLECKQAHQTAFPAGTQPTFTEQENADSIEEAIKKNYAYAIGGHPTQPYGNGGPTKFAVDDDRQFYAGDELFHRLATGAMIADDPAKYGAHAVPRAHHPVAAAAKPPQAAQLVEDKEFGKLSHDDQKKILSTSVEVMEKTPNNLVFGTNRCKKLTVSDKKETPDGYSFQAEVKLEDGSLKTFDCNLSHNGNNIVTAVTGLDNPRDAFAVIAANSMARFKAMHGENSSVPKVVTLGKIAIDGKEDESSVVTQGKYANCTKQQQAAIEAYFKAGYETVEITDVSGNQKTFENPDVGHGLGDVEIEEPTGPGLRP